MAGPTSATVKVPSWITLGQIISGIGGLLMFIGFIFGYLAVTNFQTSSGSGNINNFDGDLEGFFMITGFGVLLLVGGWLMHSVWPKFQARPRPAPVYPTPAPAAPAPEGMPQAPPPPQAAPAAPNCAKCGRPTTYIAQYGRYYCYTDNLYV